MTAFFDPNHACPRQPLTALVANRREHAEAQIAQRPSIFSETSGSSTGTVIISCMWVYPLKL